MTFCCCANELFVCICLCLVLFVLFCCFVPRVSASICVLFCVAVRQRCILVANEHCWLQLLVLLRPERAHLHTHTYTYGCRLAVVRFVLLAGSYLQTRLCCINNYYVSSVTRNGVYFATDSASAYLGRGFLVWKHRLKDLISHKI